jgi:hypothetical protein
MGLETSQPQREITRRSKRLVAAEQVVAPTELIGFVDHMVDAGAFRVATLDHTLLPTPIPMAIIHMAIGTDRAGKGSDRKPAEHRVADTWQFQNTVGV